MRPVASFKRVCVRSCAHPARRLAVALATLFVGSAGHGARAADVASQVSEKALQPELRQALRNFGELGSVLFIAAHPDDENTQLIAYLAKGRGLRTGYLSLTRGDGGQNEIGPEFGEKLGLARTYELLAARAQDGGHQFFTRAIDFGFSKSVEETLRFWDRQQVLSDVVRVIRTFRPDVIVTRFSPVPGGTHGHHTASAVLALEAFKLAGDPTAFPEQLATLQPWQPVRVVHNHWDAPRGDQKPAPLVLDIGGTDPVTGEGLGTIAARSRAMHVTQGFANYTAGSGNQSRKEVFLHLAGSPAEHDLLDGVSRTWERYPGGSAIAAKIEALAANQTQDPVVVVKGLQEIAEALGKLPGDPLVKIKQADLDRLITRVLGLEIDTRITDALVTPGDTIALQHHVRLAVDAPVQWVGVAYPAASREQRVDESIVAGKPSAFSDRVTVPRSIPLTHPYWLREPGRSGISTVTDASLIGLPSNPPAFPIEYRFSLYGHDWRVRTQAVQPIAEAPAAQQERPLTLIAPVAVDFAHGVQLFAPSSTRRVNVTVDAAQDNTAGTLELIVPDGWKAQPTSQPFRLQHRGERARLAFDVTAPATGASAQFSLRATVDGQTYSTSRTEIRYPHLPVLTLQPNASLRAVTVDLAIRPGRIGYIPGAGDAIADAIEEMGYSVDTLKGADLVAERLRGLDAIVLGVRAFNERSDLAAHLPALWEYVAEGGTVIVQYNRPNRLQTEALAPYTLSIAGDAPRQRVTDETADVRLLEPTHPAFTLPNRIGPADFVGWVQERGAYYPSKWDESNFTALMEMHDPGEEPLRSALLVAPYGKGHYVYTGLSFFRQLPAGVPGAYRLFANLLSLGRHE